MLPIGDELAGYLWVHRGQVTLWLLLAVLLKAVLTIDSMLEGLAALAPL